jgi:2-oxoisovalerate dehydrogenase E2 component (dihydrolipoyl transacylase)
MAERVFNVPDLGEGLEEAEIVEWKVAEDDAVELNQPLVDVNTAKALVEIPSPFAGRVTRLHGADGEVVKVGAPLVTFELEESEGDAATAAPAEGVATPAAEEASQPKREAVLVGYGVDTEAVKKRRRRLRPPGATAAAPAAPPEPHPAPGPRVREGAVRATPPVRKLAKERGVDLTAVSGTGPEGRITREDVLRTGAGAAGTAPGGRTVLTPSARWPLPQGADARVPVRGVRRLIAQKMERAWREIPHVSTFHPTDMTWVDALRRELTEESGTKVSALAVVVRALVEVCRAHPILNASYDAEAHEVVLRGDYHVGIAADTERGLMVPVVRDAERKGIVTLAGEISQVVALARDGRATPEHLTGSTITVTNYGTFGSWAGTPIINHPEAAILGVGAIRPTPTTVDGAVEVRPGTILALTFDHRIIDGADADQGMTDLRAILESPFRLGALPRG